MRFPLQYYGLMANSPNFLSLLPPCTSYLHIPIYFSVMHALKSGWTWPGTLYIYMLVPSAITQIFLTKEVPTVINIYLSIYLHMQKILEGWFLRCFGARDGTMDGWMAWGKGQQRLCHSWSKALSAPAPLLLTSLSVMLYRPPPFVTYCSLSICLYVSLWDTQSAAAVAFPPSHVL